ncbi:MAG: thrombospondin type 3 repeat-containing protein [Bacteroidales bacterium]|nr:thrombospondin type 3 repeat-containing protein [Bacteroidales bacterium]
MKHHYIFILILIAGVINIKPVFSQNYLAFSNDNYAGVTGMFYQPASIADSRYKFDMEIVGISTSFENNWWGIDSKVIYNPSLTQQKKFVENYVNVVDNNDPKYIFQSVEARGLSFMFNIGSKSSFGFSARVRQVLNLDNIDPVAAELMLNENNVPDLFGKTINYNDMSLNMIAWADYGLTYAQVFLKNKKHMIKGGITAKLLQGMGSGYLYAEDVKYKLVNDSIGQDVVGDFKFGASANMDDILEFQFASNPTVAFDFGFIYEFRPKYEEAQYKMDGKEGLWRKDLNKYLLRFSFSMLDIGQMTFEKQFNSNDFKLTTDELNFNELGVESFEALADSTIDMQTSTDANYVYRLPTTINMNLDIRIASHLFVNVGGRYAFNRDFSHYSKAHYLNSINITPRFETSRFGVAVPVRYNQFNDLSVGLGLRLGPLWIGSNNLLAAVGLKDNITSADIYIALKFNIKHKAPKDDDGDGVSNSLDECDDIKGPLEFKGCPDSDGDGVPNKIDECPYTAGLEEFKGCPDYDGDGVEDKYDKCPEEPGSKLNSGCPEEKKEVIEEPKKEEIQKPLEETKEVPEKEATSENKPEKTKEAKENTNPENK